jgi:hypothetical protein
VTDFEINRLVKDRVDPGSLRLRELIIAIGNALFQNLSPIVPSFDLCVVERYQLRWDFLYNSIWN